MRKKLSLIFVLALAVILAVSMVACNKKAQSVAPPAEQVAPGADSSDIESQAARIGLRFSMPYANSVFNAVYISDFHIEDVSYTFVYFDKDGSELSSKRVGNLTEDMVDEADRKRLSIAGTHSIHVTATTDSGKEVKGQFSLRLKDDAVKLETSHLDFLLDADAIAYFGTNVTINNEKYARAEFDVGSSINSWSDFVSAFRFGNAGKALTAVTYMDGNSTKTLSAEQGFPFEIKALQYTFTLVWTKDVVHVKFDLNLPAGATPLDEQDDPRSLFAEGGKYFNVEVQRNVSAVNKPDTSEFNKFAGFYFSGWYLPSEDGSTKYDRLWDFSKIVGNQDITLYAKWAEHSYSYTIYPMGGGFKKGITPSQHTGEGGTMTPITAENYANFGYKLLTSSTRFSVSGTLMRVTFDGFVYGESYDKYVAEVTVSSEGDKVFLLFSDIYADDNNRIFDKNANCLAFGGLFEEQTCDPDSEYSHTGGAKVTGDRVGYIGWELNESLPSSARDVYFRDVLYVLSQKADGSVRIDATKDNSVNVAIIPATVDLGDGTQRPVTEIGDRAISNLRALRSVDASEAVNLTRIGREAFAFDTNLSEFIQPTDAENNHITIVGQDAFVNTAYEDRYTSISGLDFIIINKVLYKYTGTLPEGGVLDLTNSAGYYSEENFKNLPSGTVTPEAIERLNAQLKAVTHIMSGAFERAQGLTELRLDEVFEYIEAGAFSGLANFKTLAVPEENNLRYVSEDAFEDCDLFMSRDGGNYDEASGGILIGNIYYYQLDRDRQAVTIPASHRIGETEYSIKVIAPHAFYSCERLSDVTFEKEENIIQIGADAFWGTPYAEKQPYLVINGILACFYGPTVRNSAIPAGVKEIAEDAFGNGAGALETLEIQISEAQESFKINSYAFKGAVKLKAIILSSVRVGADSKTLAAGSPSIAENAFANKNDAMNDDLKIYFSGSVISLLSSPREGTTADPVTAQWAELYALSPNNFAEEKITSVTLKADTIPLVYLDQTANALDAAGAAAIFKAFFGDASNASKLKSAIVVVSNTGAEPRYNDLDLSKVSFKALKDASKYNKNGSHFILSYAYDDANYKGIFKDTEGEEGAVVMSFYKAVKGAPSMDEPQRYTENKDSNMWIEGLAGDYKGSSIPTFFTSTDKTKLKATLKYKDMAGKECEIPIDVGAIAGFELTEEIARKTVTINVDFYGLGAYKFNYTYSAQRARYNNIEQTEPISIPINADAATYFRAAQLDLIGEDGVCTRMKITNSDFSFDTSKVDTSKLGQSTLTVNFLNVAMCTKTLSVDVVYSVILEANEEDFEFAIISNVPIDGYDGTAKIVGYKNKGALSVIIPETYKVKQENGETKTYKVTQIGELSAGSSSLTGVFAGCSRLQTVYLSNNIEHIGVGAFAGTAQLRNIMTATASSIGVTPVDKSNFDPIEGVEDTQEKIDDKLSLVKHMTLKGLSGVICEPINDGEYYGLAIKPEYSYGETDKETGLPIVYRVNRIADGLRLPQYDSSKPLYLYIPSTVYNSLNVKDHEGKDLATNVNVVFYENVNERYVVTDKIDDALKSIANNAFNGCSSLQFNENSFAGTTQLSEIGVSAFAGTGISSIDLSNTKISEINVRLFDNCGLLEEASFPSSVTAILDEAFSGCVLLGSIKFGENKNSFGNALDYIGRQAFNGCISLMEITLGAQFAEDAATLGEGAATLGEGAFANCRALVITCGFDKPDPTPTGWNELWNNFNCPVIYGEGESKVDESGNAYVTANGIRYMISKKALEAPDESGRVATVFIQSYGISQADIAGTISYGDHSYKVTSIAEGAFDGNSRLKSVKVDVNVTSIGAYAFRNCSALETFEFTQNGEPCDGKLTQVGNEAFAGCSSLKDIPKVQTSAASGKISAPDSTRGEDAIVKLSAFVPDAFKQTALADPCKKQA